MSDGSGTAPEQFRAWVGDGLAGHAEIIRRAGGWWSVELHADVRSLAEQAGYRERDFGRPHGFRREQFAREFAADFAADLVRAARREVDRRWLAVDPATLIPADADVYASCSDVHALIPHVQHVVDHRVCGCVVH